VIWKVSESLVAVYISQVLEGLVYLHDQGVNRVIY
jgi:serine/threonine protein kinase